LSAGSRLDRSTAWPYFDGQTGEFVYSREDHPAGADVEHELGALDGGHALLFASGMAAAATALLGMLRTGATVAIAEGGYYGTSALARRLQTWGLRCLEFDQTRPPPAGTDLVWLEAPSNPFLAFPDLEAAAAHPAPVLVDATVATPVLLRPLEHGADVVLHSATKALGGHGDLLLGVLVCRSPEIHADLKHWRSQLGAAAAPDPAWLLSRSLRTLRLRLERQSATALDLAHRLAGHPHVERVWYPGLGPDPRAARWMSGGFGGLISFEVRGNAEIVERTTRLIANKTSLGGVESNLETRRRWEGDRVPAGLIRLSVGLEDVDELWADLEHALAAA
jgi:cystathionine gamma-synthase